MIYPPQNSDRRDEETIFTTEKDLSVSSISSVDEYDAGLKKPVEDNEEVPLSRNARFLLWTVLNVASTVGIVCTPYYSIFPQLLRADPRRIR